MRYIEISTDVYASIWVLRVRGEESEDEVLTRVLAGLLEGIRGIQREITPDPPEGADTSARRPTWASDLVESLKLLGGKAHLQNIYGTVERIRRREGRSIPRTLEGTVRRTLESYCAESHNYLGGRDLFSMPEGKGTGVWGLRAQVA